MHIFYLLGVQLKSLLQITLPQRLSLHKFQSLRNSLSTHNHLLAAFFFKLKVLVRILFLFLLIIYNELFVLPFDYSTSLPPPSKLHTILATILRPCGLLSSWV